MLGSNIASLNLSRFVDADLDLVKINLNLGSIQMELAQSLLLVVNPFLIQLFGTAFLLQCEPIKDFEFFSNSSILAKFWQEQNKKLPLMGIEPRPS